MAKAWRNEAARKINARRKAGSKEGSARMQKNERLFLAKVWTIKAAGNYLLSGLLERTWPWASAPARPAHNWYYHSAPVAEVVDKAVPTEGVIKSFLRKAKSFFTGK